MVGYIAHLLTWLAAVIAVMGRTHNEHASGLSRFTILGWILVLLASLSFLVATYELYSTRERSTYEQSAANDEVIGVLEDLYESIGRFVECRYGDPRDLTTKEFLAALETTDLFRGDPRYQAEHVIFYISDQWAKDYERLVAIIDNYHSVFSPQFIRLLRELKDDPAFTRIRNWSSEGITLGSGYHPLLTPPGADPHPNSAFFLVNVEPVEWVVCASRIAILYAMVADPEHATEP